jgi:REP element-mobilizing transposase RayT
VPVTLDAHRRSVVEASVREACRIKRWGLHAVNVRTNHVHAVVSPTNSAERILSTLKANSTQRLRAAGCWESERSPWAGGGSKRYLWTERSVEMAINYVVNGQGGPLPDFSVE